MGVRWPRDAVDLLEQARQFAALRWGRERHGPEGSLPGRAGNITGGCHSHIESDYANDRLVAEEPIARSGRALVVAAAHVAATELRLAIAAAVAEFTRSAVTVARALGTEADRADAGLARTVLQTDRVVSQLEGTDVTRIAE